jgi:hypothetical protein
MLRVDRREDGVHLLFTADVAWKDQWIREHCGQLAHVLLEPLTLMGQCQ